ncbi:MAG TPA: AAA family ATPase [Rhodocyclaceae bacterium]|nr:AAA family ATPase [Rhodocyclaceae bacterium]
MNFLKPSLQRLRSNRRLRYGLILAVGIAAAGILSTYRYLNPDVSPEEIQAKVTNPTAATGPELLRLMANQPAAWFQTERQADTLLADLQGSNLLAVGITGGSDAQEPGAGYVLAVTKAGLAYHVADTWRGDLAKAVIDQAKTTSFPVASVGAVGKPGFHLPAGMDASMVIQLLLFALFIPLVRDMLPQKFALAERPDTGFDSVIGAHEAKAALQDIVSFLKKPEDFTRLGARPTRGVLLSGPPGTGKTLLARALAGETGAAFIACTGADFSAKYYGAGIAKVKSLFRTARKQSSCIIFIDEIDGIGQRTDSREGPGASESNRIINQLLVEMDGFAKDARIIVIGATNLVDNIDPALRREGRFDRHVRVRIPDVKEREQLLAHYGKGVTTADDVDYAQLARLTMGLSPAAIAAAVNQAALLAARQGRAGVAMQDFMDAVETKHMGEVSGRALSPDERARTAYHEAGHALIAALLGTGKVEKVSVLPRGDALGVTLVSDDDAKLLRTQIELENRIQMLLAGRCAEELIYGQASTGAGHDLQQASKIAYDMVARYGLGQEGRLFSLAALERHEVDSRHLVEEANATLKRLCDLCTANLVEQRQALETLTAALLEQETVPGEYVESLLKPEAPEQPLLAAA